MCKFDIVNFPFLSSNIPQSPAYVVFVSQLIRYARASSLYEDFIMRSQLLTSKLLKQGFTRNRLIATFKKFYGRHIVLVDRFKVSPPCRLGLRICRLHPHAER